MALGHGAQRVAGPERGGGGGGRLEAVGEAHRLGQGDRLGAPGEHRLGPQVDLDARDLAGHELAAEPVRGLQEGDPHSGGDEAVGGGQAGDAAADDDDVARGRFRTLLRTLHGSTLSNPYRVPTVTTSKPVGGNRPRGRRVEPAMSTNVLGGPVMDPVTDGESRSRRSFVRARAALVAGAVGLLLAVGGCGASGDASDSGAKAADGKAAPREGFADEAGAAASAAPEEQADGKGAGRKAAPKPGAPM